VYTTIAWSNLALRHPFLSLCEPNSLPHPQ
jgi:hypothetical protein